MLVLFNVFIILIESMKDFQEFLDSSNSQQPQPHLGKPTQPSNDSSLFYKEAITKVLPYVSPFLLSIVTGPFSTLSTLLQVTNKGMGSGLQAKIKAAPLLQRHINNGVFGDNRIYEAPSVKNYRDGFSRLGKEGIRGIYKGNLTGILLAASNAWLREKMYVGAG